MAPSSHTEAHGVASINDAHVASKPRRVLQRDDVTDSARRRQLAVHRPKAARHYYRAGVVESTWWSSRM
eukprot:6205858-Pleurochrysis_carterae.AAC.1